MGKLPFHFLCLVAVAAIMRHHVTSVSGGECRPMRKKGGLNLLNCSNADLSQLPLPHLDDTAEIIDFSRNQFDSLPIMPNSRKCTDTKHCNVINNTDNYCRYGISFSRNKITTVTPSAMKHLRCLNSLDLSYNEINWTSLETTTFLTGLSKLETLILAGNPLGKLPDNVIVEPFIPELRYLDLSNCDLEELEENSVDDFHYLSTLILRNNRLSNLKHGTFKGLNALKLLDLRFNKIMNLGPELFADVEALHSLLLASNHIHSIAKDAFRGSMKILELTSNNLKAVPYESLHELPHLEHLVLSYNPIEKLSTPNSSITLRSVTTLELNGMLWMTKMDKGELAAFPSLVTLSLQRNRNLKTIHPHFLPRNSSKLREVHLSNSGLTTLASDALPWKQLTYLSLKGNPWMCDYRIQWMVGAKVVEKGNVICDLPIELRGRDIKSVDPRKLQQYFPLTAIFGLVGVALTLPVLTCLVYLVWKRKHHFCHSCSDVHGRYVTVFTRDAEGEGDDHVDIDIRANQRSLRAVSNGDADDTAPFIMLEQEQDVSRGDEDEI